MSWTYLNLFFVFVGGWQCLLKGRILSLLLFTFKMLHVFLVLGLQSYFYQGFALQILLPMQLLGPCL